MSEAVDRRLAERGAAGVLVVARTTTLRPAYERRLRGIARGARAETARAVRQSMDLGEEVEEVVAFPRLGAAFVALDAPGAAALRSDPETASVDLLPRLEPIFARTAVSAVTPDPEWGLRMLRAPEAWALGHRGAGVLVGHVDTGIDDRHPSLRGVATAFARFLPNGAGGSLPPPAFDTQGHGTHTAGTLAGRPHAGRAVGVAPEAHLAAAIYAWNHASPQLSLLRCLDWVVASGAAVLSLSVGMTGCDLSLAPVFARLRAHGVLPVVSVGNDGAGFARFPGSYADSLSVGATTAPPPTPRGGIWASSGSGGTCPGGSSTVPELVAPGSPVSSAQAGTTGFVWLDGTSCAVPHVAGLAAILRGAKPSATVAEVEAAILASCRPVPGEPAARQGAGVPDAVAALGLLTGASPPSA